MDSRTCSCSIRSAATSCSAAGAGRQDHLLRSGGDTGSRAKGRRCSCSRGSPGVAHRHLQEGYLRQGAGADHGQALGPGDRRGQHIKAYQQEIRQKILDMYGLPAVPEEIENYIQRRAPSRAMEESAMFDAVVDVVMKGDYDYYIYDLVPLVTRCTTCRWPRSTTSGSTKSPSCARRCASTRRW